MNSLISKNILSIISNSVALAQIFIVVLFFECYSIQIENQSLLDLKISFDTLHIKPFFAFLYFVAVARMFWAVIYIIKSIFNLYSDTKFSSKILFTAFLLSILCFYYWVLLNENPKLSPFYKSTIKIDFTKFHFILQQ